MHIWRISEFQDLSGRGGLYASGRWHKKGIPVVYCSDHPSTALLEILVHVDMDTIPDTFQLMKIECPENVSVLNRVLSKEPIGTFSDTQDFGSDFLNKGDFCVLSVRSAIMPEAVNMIFNPRHADAARIKIVQAWRYPFDSRLFR